MKKNLPVSIREQPFPEGAEIVSATDLKGIITDCNQAFIDISGFSREELIGHSHNIVRHPDVPPAVFANLWDTLKAGKPWMGIVKNRYKNGDHYWVDAYVTPIIQDGEVTGYESVRVKPARDRVKAAEKLYQDIANNRPLTSFFSMDSTSSLLLGSAVALTAFMAVMLFLTPANWLLTLISWLIAMATAWAILSGQLVK
jgi:aerotaxis receptor